MMNNDQEWSIMINNYNECLILITNDDQIWLKHDQTWSIIIMTNNDQ